MTHEQIAELTNAPCAIVKYSMRSIIPSMGSVSGLWLRAYITARKSDKTGQHSLAIASKAMRQKDAEKYIADHGFKLLLKNTDGEVWGTPDNAFRDYCRQHDLQPADDMGLSTIFDNNGEE